MKNTIQPEVDSSKMLIETQDEDIQSFIALHQKWRSHSLRTNKISIVREDYKILEDLDRQLPETLSPTMKNSALYKLLRIFDLEASQLPKTKPVLIGATDVTLSVLDNVKDLLVEVGELGETWKDVLKGFVAEGTVFVHEGIDEAGDFVPLEACELGEMYFNPEMQELADESSRRGKRAKSIIREVSMSYAEFKDLYPDFAGKVTAGAPSPEERQQVFNIKTDGVKDDKENIIIHYAYSIEDGKRPVMCIYGGGNGVKLDKQEGKDYPFWKLNKSGKRQAFLPFRVAHFAPRSQRRGFYSPSIIGMCKDGVKTLDQMFRVSFPVFSKMVNPILFIMGDSDQRDIEAMQIAGELQQLGVSQMIPLGNKATGVQELKPASIAADLESFRQLVLRELSQRFDINLLALEEVEQTATETIAKVKAELKAIQGLYKTNQAFFAGLLNDMVAIFSEYGNKRLKRQISISLSDEDGEEMDIDMATAIMVLEEWNGDFFVETDLKMPMSTQDKANGIQEVQAFKQNAFYGTPFATPEQMSTTVGAVYALAVLRDVDDIFTRQALLAEVEQIFAGKTQAAELNGGTVKQAAEEGVSNEEVASELAPQSFLSQAGL